MNYEPLKLNSKFILVIAMAYLTFSLAADAIAYKFCLIGPLIESGATILFPITYTLGDIVTEVYGYATARKLVWFGLGCELIFALLLELIIKFPSPPGFQYQAEYRDIFHPILWFVISGIVADVASSFANIYIISKFKIFMRGKNFILRGIGAQAIAEAIMHTIVCFMAFSSMYSLMTVLKITLSAYLLEMIYAVIFVFPAWLLIIILKRHEGIDAYDYNIKYNIFKLN